MKGCRQVKSLLFVNKKKQKNFIHLRPLQGELQTNESFLVLFFKKEHACFLDQDHTP
jgi:hypothetical protein